MCTVSWAVLPDGYVLLFNRDEMRTRRPATAPVERESRGVRYLAPIDGDHGGTWILVNEHGLTLGLLNYYPGGVELDLPDRPSRGHLLMGQADAANWETLNDRLQGMDLALYPPFQMIILNTVGLGLLTWDGRELMWVPSGVHPPLTSSSYHQEEVEDYRRSRFPIEGGVGDLDQYHHAHDPSAPAHSVLMSREDACTHSITRIEVDTTQACMRYEPQSWLTQPAEPVNAALSLRGRRIDTQ